MFKIACLFLLVAIANAQLWPWPQPQPEIQPIPPLVEINPPNLTPRPRPPIVNEEENRPGAGHKNKCPSVNGRQATIFPHESNCHQFYICNDGFAFVFTCPNGLKFDRNELACSFQAVC